MESPFVVVAGVGSGIGAAVAREFAQRYPVVMLNRNSKKIEWIQKEIEADGRTAICISCDISDKASVDAAFRGIVDELGDRCAAAVFNASTRPFPWPFLWQKEDALKSAVEVNVKGAFLFAQATLPLLKNAVPAAEHSPTLIFTGATASVKANAWMQPFAMSKHALRALAESLSKEFGPEGVHVAHVVVDGVVRMDLTWFLKFFGPRDSKFDPKAIADVYWHLHEQDRSTFSFETTIRPFCEKW